MKEREIHQMNYNKIQTTKISKNIEGHLNSK